MTNYVSPTPPKQSMILLSRLLLTPQDGSEPSLMLKASLDSDLRGISREDFDQLVSLANSNHVVVRGMEIILNTMREQNDEVRAGWAETELEKERGRIANALPFLEDICHAFEAAGHDITVIKSLDHWPDLGSDIDLFTNTDAATVVKFMTRRFNAQVAQRSWGDRLAGKWNFMIPGLPEAVEIHVGRLGQTGEQVKIAAHLTECTRHVTIGSRVFRVPSASHRLMISTLQRMYRHFYFRLCDIVDSAALVDSGAVDFQDLRSAAMSADIWEGVATYLVIVSDYVTKYRGTGLDLPFIVQAAARFDGDDLFYAREFLRVPIMPQSARLYGEQLTGLLRKLELKNGARLSLLPCLATAALVGQRITGSDKGIW